jgi:hypothetical protein
MPAAFRLLLASPDDVEIDLAAVPHICGERLGWEKHTQAQTTQERTAPASTKLSTEAFALVKKVNALKKLSQLALDIPEEPDASFEDMVG